EPQELPQRTAVPRHLRPRLTTTHGSRKGHQNRCL
ncbi:MAG: hypothetical protein AVDCRST_MAG01-01-4220, partial [uncultured Rubrobacteraceae bacterium]